jgi:hypothetical protein
LSSILDLLRQLALDVKLVGHEGFHLVGEVRVDLGDRLELDLFVALTVLIAGPIAQGARGMSRPVSAKSRDAREWLPDASATAHRARPISSSE